MQSLCHFTSLDRQHGGVGANCGLHPLIHTLLGFNLVIDVVGTKKAEPVRLRTSLNKVGVPLRIRVPEFHNSSM